MGGEGGSGGDVSSVVMRLFEYEQRRLWVGVDRGFYDGKNEGLKNLTKFNVVGRGEG